MTAYLALLAQTKVGFLSGGRGRSFHQLTPQEQIAQKEEAFARATMALARAQPLGDNCQTELCHSGWCPAPDIWLLGIRISEDKDQGFNSVAEMLGVKVDLTSDDFSKVRDLWNVSIHQRWIPFGDHPIKLERYRED